MANITISVEELLVLMKGEDTESLRNIKENMKKLLFEKWLADPSFVAQAEAIAHEYAEKKIKRHVETAFQEVQIGYSYNKRTELQGWAAEMLKSALQSYIANDATFKKTVETLVHQSIGEMFAKGFIKFSMPEQKG